MKNYILMICVAVFLTSCVSTMPLTATSNSINESDKVGTSKSVWLLGFLPISGDSGDTKISKGVDQSIFTDAKNGGIDKISTVESRTTIKLFGLITEYETIVHGY